MACHIVRNAKHDEWKKFGETLQEEFQHNQKRFWAKTRGKRVSGQVLCEEEEVRKRWKDYFSSLLQGE